MGELRRDREELGNEGIQLENIDELNDTKIFKSKMEARMEKARLNTVMAKMKAQETMFREEEEPITGRTDARSLLLWEGIFCEMKVFHPMRLTSCFL